MVDVAGAAIDIAEKLAQKFDDLEAHHAGEADPHYAVSEVVRTSQERGVHVYHLPDDQLGHGSSLGNTSVWAETKGNGHLLHLHSIPSARRLLGGMSVTYMVPFTDLTMGTTDNRERNRYARLEPSATGSMHLHPAYQQRELVLGDGLHALETFFVPRTGQDTDPAMALTTICLTNRTPHPIKISLVAGIDLRGDTPRDLEALYDRDRHALLAHNRSSPERVRFFCSPQKPDHFWATNDEEEAYSPVRPLPDATDHDGDLVGALQFHMFLLPQQWRKISLAAGISLEGIEPARKMIAQVHKHEHTLRKTVEHYENQIDIASMAMPDDLLTQGIQWAKANMVRPLADYRIGPAFTNDPGNSSNIVGRDMAWYVHGGDYFLPDACYQMLCAFAKDQRDTGLIAEYIDGNTGQSEDHDFNINDNTPLFVIAVDHHYNVTANDQHLEALYEPARKAAELILRQRSGKGLIECTARGLGVAGICGWRNVLDNEQISGCVTEVNAECYGALRAMARLARAIDRPDDSQRYDQAGDQLRKDINHHLIDPDTDLYIRNVDPDGRVFTQATGDLVFPLMFGVADEKTRRNVTGRLLRADFMSSGGMRALPNGNPRYNPSEKAGLLGGVWPGVTWWFSMGCTSGDPGITADALRRSYAYLIRDPKTFNTVPGQFNEWSDGQTLVNRGMRLSPWGPPRFLWAAIEGLAGVDPTTRPFSLRPELPPDWSWLRLWNLTIQGQDASLIIVRQKDQQLHVYTTAELQTDLPTHRFDAAIDPAIETLTTGVTAAAMRRGREIMLFVGSSRDQMLITPMLTHHAIDRSQRYRLARLQSLDPQWEDLGEIEGRYLQRMAIQVEARGYAIYHLQPV